MNEEMGRDMRDGSERSPEEKGEQYAEFHIRLFENGGEVELVECFESKMEESVQEAATTFLRAFRVYSHYSRTMLTLLRHSARELKKDENSRTPWEMLEREKEESEEIANLLSDPGEMLFSWIVLTSDCQDDMFREINELGSLTETEDEEDWEDE